MVNPPTDWAPLVGEGTLVLPDFSGTPAADSSPIGQRAPLRRLFAEYPAALARLVDLGRGKRPQVHALAPANVRDAKRR